MLTKSLKDGKELTVGPRLKKFIEAGYGSELLWEENYPDQEELGEFQHTRDNIETASLEELFDLWCRGQNLMGFAGKVLRATAAFRKIVR